jgi:hypothetical protein
MAKKAAKGKAKVRSLKAKSGAARSVKGGAEPITGLVDPAKVWAPEYTRTLTAKK